MTTIDEIRDIVFYIIRKLNDFINNFTTEQQPPQQPRPQPHFRRMTEEEIRRDDERHENIMRQIEEIERSLYTPPPSPIIPTRTEEECERIDAGVSELLRKLMRNQFHLLFHFHLIKK